MGLTVRMHTWLISVSFMDCGKLILIIVYDDGSAGRTDHIGRQNNEVIVYRMLPGQESKGGEGFNLAGITVGLRLFAI